MAELNRDMFVKTKLGPLIELARAAGWGIYIETIEPFRGTGDETMSIGTTDTAEGHCDAAVTLKATGCSTEPAEIVTIARLVTPS